MKAYGFSPPEGMIGKPERAAELYVKLMKPGGRTPGPIDSGAERLF
jgi:hypothetical protein